MACCYCLNPDHTACRLSDNRLRWMLTFLCMKPCLVIFRKGILIMNLLHLIRTLRWKKIVTFSAPRRNMSQSMKLKTIYKRSIGAAKQATTRTRGNRAETTAQRNNKIDNFILTLWFEKIKKVKKMYTYSSPREEEFLFFTHNEERCSGNVPAPVFWSSARLKKGENVMTQYNEWMRYVSKII